MKAFPLALAALFAATGCPRKEEAPEKEAEHSEKAEPHAHDKGDAARVHIDPEMLRDLRVTTAPVEARPGGEGVTALGELTVNEDAYAEVPAPVPARVVALLVAAGEPVAAKQPLATLQSPELGRARAAFQTAQARALSARAAADRKKDLAAERIVAERELQEAQSEAVAAEAELSAAKAALAALGVHPSGEGRGGAELTLRSPIAGTVIERNAVVGQMADPAKPLFKVGDLSRLWLTVHAFERDAVRVQRGAEARLTFAALPGQSFTAQVGLVGAQVDPASRTVPIRLEIGNPKGLLKPGMSASAFLPLGEAGGTITTVPAAALQRLDNGWYVFLPTGEEGAFERREVGRGRTLGGEVEVLSGLDAGEKVVVDGAFLLKAEFEKSRGEGEHHEH